MTDPSPYRVTWTPEQVWTNREELTHRPDGTWPAVAAVNGTVFDPPMKFEHLTGTDEVGQPILNGVPTPSEGVVIEVWPNAGGWMIGLGLSNNPGPYTRMNLVEFVWI